LTDKRANVGFIIIFGFVWIGFGIFGLIEAPDRPLVTASQFVAGVLHFVYAAILRWRKSESRRS
jgi:quinol-cytochrome oxidoreductase complex cytochrome b subunit